MQNVISQKVTYDTERGLTLAGQRKLGGMPEWLRPPHPTQAAAHHAGRNQQKTCTRAPEKVSQMLVGLSPCFSLFFNFFKIRTYECFCIKMS
jgi:hypothetical protein